MVTERTLRRWRQDALRIQDGVALEIYAGTCNALAAAYKESQERILRLTQELMDLHLMKK